MRGVNMPGFGTAERRILDYFKEGLELFFKGRVCKVIESDKPTCASGEPKTDIFVRVDDGRNCKDIKISYKKGNAVPVNLAKEIAVAIKDTLEAIC